MIIRIKPSGGDVRKIELDVLRNGTFVVRVDDMHKGTGKWSQNGEALEMDTAALDDLLGSHEGKLSFALHDEPLIHRRA